VVFKESEKQRLHYKTDWHRYNLKRKIAELQPVSEQVFGERVQLQKSEASSTNIISLAKNQAESADSPYFHCIYFHDFQ
jgi:hypothetical protein